MPALVPPARFGRDTAEATLMRLREIPAEFDRQGVADRLKRAISYFYISLDNAPELPAHFDGLKEGASALREARLLLSRAGDPAKVPQLAPTLAALDDAAAKATAHLDVLAIEQLKNRNLVGRGERSVDVPKPKPFRASVGLPELHAIVRRPLVLDVPIDSLIEIPKDKPKGPKRPPPPKTLEELQAFAEATKYGAPPLIPDEPPPAEEPPPPSPVEYAYLPAEDEVDALRVLARDALEDVAALSTLRKPIPTETWLDQAPFENRLLANGDYLASLGPISLPTVTLYHAESATPDPARAFAVAFFYGSIAGRDAVDAAVATMKLSPPEELPGYVEGFWLAPSPEIDVALAELLDSPKEPLVGVAIDVLAARGTLPIERADEVLARGSPLLRQKLSRALGVAGPKRACIERLDRILFEAKTDDDFLIALESLFRRGHGPARDAARDAINRPTSPARQAGATWLLAMGGGLNDALRLVESVKAKPSARGARALGRFGHVAALPVLFNLLSVKDEDTVEAAAESLDRITNAGLRHIVEEPWELSLPPEAREAGGIPIPLRKVEKVIVDPEPWARSIRANEPKLDKTQKIRGGIPFEIVHIVDELEAPRTPTARRGDAALELSITAGLGARFSPADWVARQRSQLSELRGAVSSMASSPGAFWFGGTASTRKDVAANPPTRKLRCACFLSVPAGHTIGSPPGGSHDRAARGND